MTAEQGSQVPEIEALRTTISNVREAQATALIIARGVLGNILERLTIPEGSSFTIKPTGIIEASTAVSEDLGESAKMWVSRLRSHFAISVSEREQSLTQKPLTHILLKTGKDLQLREIGIEVEDYFFDGLWMDIEAKAADTQYFFSINYGGPQPITILAESQHIKAGNNFVDNLANTDELAKLQFAAELLTRATPIPQAAATS